MCLCGGQTTISSTSPVVYKIFISLSNTHIKSTYQFLIIAPNTLTSKRRSPKYINLSASWAMMLRELNPAVGETAKSLLHVGTTEIRGHWRRFCSSEPKSSDKTVSCGAKRYDCCHLKSFS